MTSIGSSSLPSEFGIATGRAGRVQNAGSSRLERALIAMVELIAVAKMSQSRRIVGGIVRGASSSGR
jgi:hypothetical protein